MQVRPLHARVRFALRAFALTAYALATLAGYGLHGLVEHGHASECCHVQPHAADVEAHSHEGPTFSQSHDDCSICSFLAQAQSGTVASLAPSGREPLAEAPPLADSLVLSLRADAPHARGPPQA